MLKFIRDLFSSKPGIRHYTTDGGLLAPYPGMTDEDLKHFESEFKVPSSFPKLTDPQ